MRKYFQLATILMILHINIVAQDSINKILDIEKTCIEGKEESFIIRARCLSNYIESRYYWKINNKRSEYYGDSLIIYANEFPDDKPLIVECLLVGENYSETDTIIKRIKLDRKYVNRTALLHEYIMKNDQVLYF